MRRLTDIARENGVKRLVGAVLRENVAMLQLMSSRGFAIQATDDPMVVEAVKELTA
jgi:hypothetical protein